MHRFREENSTSTQRMMHTIFAQSSLKKAKASFKTCEKSGNSRLLFAVILPFSLSERRYGFE